MAQDEKGRFITDNKEMIAWCDGKNKEAGKKLLKWLQIASADNPNKYVGVHPDTNAIIGPEIIVGKRYLVVYSSPVRLPFIDPAEGTVALHVKEIEGKLRNTFQITNVKGIVCSPDDYTVTAPLNSDLSQFRLYVGDKLEPL